MTEFADTQSRYPNFRFVVRDTGAGMSKEFLGRLFVPFEREVRFGAANVAGTGLGMPIVHDLVRPDVYKRQSHNKGGRRGRAPLCRED